MRNKRHSGSHSDYWMIDWQCLSDVGVSSQLLSIDNNLIKSLSFNEVNNRLLITN
jgi:hypothetical protein